MDQPKSIFTLAREAALECGESFIVTFSGISPSIIRGGYPGDRAALESFVKKQPDYELIAHFRRAGPHRVRQVKV